jgi:glycosyltransferase involved in cell wall biosynthesis
MATMKSIPISVVMSVFNGQAFLAEAVESILGQSFDDFEFVIIDDGSIDRTGEMLANYVRQDERIRVHRHENKGRATSLNIGIGLARGRYIARMDADDIALRIRLEEQVRFMEEHPDVGLLGGAFELINDDGSRLMNTISFPTEDSDIKGALLVHNPVCHPTVVMRKAVFEAAGGYRKALLDADDYDLWLRVSERSQLANLKTCILQYRIHPDQVSIKGMRHQTECVLAARAAAALRRRGLPDPLSQVEEVTPELLERLGVSKATLEQHVLGGYHYWINILEKNYPQAALKAIDQVLDLHDSWRRERSEAADMYVKAAAVHYRQGRMLWTIWSVIRAILSRPAILRLLLRIAFSRGVSSGAINATVRHLPNKE